jgi:hypothetical protein
MSQGIFINLLKVTTSKELVNCKARLSNYVAEFINLDLIAKVRISRSEYLFEQWASIISLLHVLCFLCLFVANSFLEE